MYMEVWRVRKKSGMIKNIVGIEEEELFDILLVNTYLIKFFQRRTFEVRLGMKEMDRV